MLRRLAPVVQRLMLLTGRGWLKPVWLACHEAVIRGVAAYLRRGECDMSVYVRGSFAVGDTVLGVSDIDLIVLATTDPSRPGRAHARIRDRYSRLVRAVDSLRYLMGHFFVYEDADLRAATTAPALRFGLDDSAPDGSRDRAAYLGRTPVADEMGLLERPGLYGCTRDWRLVAGAERRPSETTRDAQARRVAAWLEVQRYWCWAFAACADRRRPHVPYVCVKLLADPLRVWLWLTLGETVDRRIDALELGLRLMPEEEAAVRHALELYRRLPSAPEPPLEEVFPAFLRISARIGEHLGAEARGVTETEVRLAWGAEDELVPANRDRAPPRFGRPRLLPLADWRACALPTVPDEIFWVAGHDCDPSEIVHAAAASGEGWYAALAPPGLLILPTTEIWSRGLLRAVQCRVTEPVSFALLEGRRSARFVDASGWSAHDLARRALAEHRAWLRSDRVTRPSGRLWLDTPPPSTAAHPATLAMLLSAARAALFLESLELGDPELPLTLAAVAELARVRGHDPDGVAQEALACLREARSGNREPPAVVVGAMRRLVLGLPPYTERSLVSSTSG